jgi:protein gp37
MSDETNIEWAEHTGGPYLGCSPWSPGCVNCYAWELAESRLEWLFRNAYKKAGFEDWQTRPVWGEKATRVLTKGFWKDARRLNVQHGKDIARGRWFPSMIDWLDEMPAGIIDQNGNRLDPAGVLADFLALVFECEYIQWLLLTKRPENFSARLEKAYAASFEKHGADVSSRIRHWIDGEAPANVALGVSVEDQARADERREPFRGIPAVKKFVSYEPALEDVEWTGWEFVDQIIFGGESGAKARPCDIRWGINAFIYCKEAGVKFFCKQLGARPVSWRAQNDGWPSGVEILHGNPSRLRLQHPKGGDPEEWPAVLRVRENL